MQVKRGYKVSDAVAAGVERVLPQVVGIIPVREGRQPGSGSAGRHD
jgi:hypothetical protein